VKAGDGHIEENPGQGWISWSWIATGLFAGLLALYAVGACRTIYVGDSGELVAAVHTLGIPHPSGFPLYVLLGKLWTLVLPVGSIAFRMSLFSAVCAAAACAALLLVGRVAGLDRRAAVFGALLLGFSPSFWSQANIQRVYTLNALSLAVAVLLALHWQRSRRLSWLAAAFFVCGLGATNHTFMAMASVAMGVWAVTVDPSLVKRPRAGAALVGSVAVGLLPYLYLPLRSAANPRLDWGNPETLGGFLAVVVRREFWGRRFLEGPADLVPIAADYLKSFFVELAWAGPALAVLAIAARRRHDLPLALPFLILAANFLTTALHGSRTDIFVWHRYSIPSYAMLALVAAAGAHVLLRRLPRRAGWALLLIPALLANGGWRDFDRSRYRIAEDFSQQLLSSLPPGSILAASDDNIVFVLVYLQLVEGLRPDVDLVPQGVGDTDLPELRFRPEEDPLFFTHHPNWDFPPLTVVPTGLVFRVWRQDLPALSPSVTRWSLDGESDPRIPKDYLTRNLIGHYHYMLGLTFEPIDWATAEREFRQARRAASSNDVLFYNLGLVYRRTGLYARSLAAFERAAEINPRHLASATRPWPSDRVEEAEVKLARIDTVCADLRAVDAQLSKLDPDQPAFHLRMAELLLARGETDAAVGHLRCAAEMGAGITEHQQGCRGLW
jgi:tetratricopeptide (TPR) repeat protein